MRFPRATARALAVAAPLLVGLFHADHEAVAGRRISPPTSLAGVPYRQEYLPGAVPSLEVCKLGEHSAPFSTENVIFFNSDDRYYTWLQVTPDSCSPCTSNTFARITVAHIFLYFPAAPETVTLETNVVAIIPTPCRFQDPSVVMCPPFETTLINPDPIATVEYAIPFPTDCLIHTPPNGSGQAFLGFTFLTANDTTLAHKPRIVVDQIGQPCRSYNPVGDTNYDFVTEFNSGNPVMYAEVEQCESVPVRRRSWGQLKLLYR